MFTGIIEEVGTVQQIRNGAHSSALTIHGDVIFGDLKLGDSVAVNGVCLTVSGYSSDTFTADVMHETLLRSSVGGLKPGSRVNLERAMPANGRFGGHIVSGHIDGTGVITEIKTDGNAVLFTINTSEKILRYIVEKGSVAIDGISLTVVSVASGSFSVSIIPHTAKFTSLSQKAAGDKVNLETDIIGKYVEKLIAPGQGKMPESNITKEFLLKYGY